MDSKKKSIAKYRNNEVLLKKGSEFRKRRKESGYGSKRQNHGHTAESTSGEENLSGRSEPYL